MTETVNLGLIDGATQYLRDKEYALYRSNSNPEFAKKAMAAKGWGDIITIDDEQDTPVSSQTLHHQRDIITIDDEQDTPEAKMDRLTDLANAAIKQENITEQIFIDKIKTLNRCKNTSDDDLRKIYQDAVNRAKEATEPTQEN